MAKGAPCRWAFKLRIRIPKVSRQTLVFRQHCQSDPPDGFFGDCIPIDSSHYSNRREAVRGEVDGASRPEPDSSAAFSRGEV